MRLVTRLLKRATPRESFILAPRPAARAARGVARRPRRSWRGRCGNARRARDGPGCGRLEHGGLRIQGRPRLSPAPTLRIGRFGRERRPFATVSPWSAAREAAPIDLTPRG